MLKTIKLVETAGIKFRIEIEDEFNKAVDLSKKEEKFIENKVSRVSI